MKPSSSSSSQPTSTTTTIVVDREEKVRQLKYSLAWLCCDELLVPPIPVLEPLRLLNTDTDEIKQEKREKHAKLLEARDRERKKREPELLSSLDRVVDRVLVARPQYKKMIDYATITDQSKTVKLSCSNCKNKNPDDFFADPKSGDTVCLNCGLVVHALGIDKGAAKRNFEGEEVSTYSNISISFTSLLLVVFVYESIIICVIVSNLSS